MLTTSQHALIDAIEQLDPAKVQDLLSQGLDPNFMDPEKGLPITVVCDGLFQWWETLCDAAEAGKPLSEQQKQQLQESHG